MTLFSFREISLSLLFTFILPLSIHHYPVSIKMAKRGVTTFSATQVAKQGLAVSTAMLKMADLEKEVSRLRHHVSVLSRRNHGLQKELDGLRVVGEGVASNKEPEPQVVVEPPEPIVDMEVAPSEASEEEDDVAEAFVALASVAGVRVASEAKPAVAESRVALEINEPEVALVRLPKGKKRRLTVGGDGDESGDDSEVMTVVPVQEEGEVMVAPLGPRLQTLVVPRGPRLADGPAVRGWNVVRREYRFVDRSLIGLRNGMVGDTYRTRGNFARAPFVNRGGGFVGRGNRPCR